MNNTINRILNLVTEAGITKMVRRGDYGDNGIAKTAQAAYKLKSSRNRARKTVNSGDGQFGPFTGKEYADNKLQRHPKAAANLRTPAPLERSKNHKAAAVVSKKKAHKAKKRAEKFPSDGINRDKRNPDGTRRPSFKL